MITRCIILFSFVLLLMSCKTHTTSSSDEVDFEVLMANVETKSEHRSVSSQIREARISKGVPRAILAREVGLTEDQLINIERGVATPTREILFDLERKLEIEVVISD